MYFGPSPHQRGYIQGVYFSYRICIQSHYLNLDTRWLDTCIQYVWADFRYGPTEYLAFEQCTINPLLVLVLVGFAFFHYWWLIGYCLYLFFPFSIR
jgi:hypothetical protein